MRSIMAARRSFCTKPAFTPAQTILSSIKAMIPRAITTGIVQNGEPILYVEPKDVPLTLTFLRDHTGTRCKQLLDITAVDVPAREKRFEVGPTPESGHSPPRPRLAQLRSLHGSRPLKLSVPPATPPRPPPPPPRRRRSRTRC
tara:strand:+ start:5802 stop:6230 length:429 start_codon:yes stop_codon:yes gene_type:complete